LCDFSIGYWHIEDKEAVEICTGWNQEKKRRNSGNGKDLERPQENRSTHIQSPYITPGIWHHKALAKAGREPCIASGYNNAYDTPAIYLRN
jgi:hypothetical protein